MSLAHHDLGPVPLESGGAAELRLAVRRTGRGPARVLLVHALTGGPDPEAWWGPLFGPGAPLDPEAATVWAPNLPGSCYGSTGPEEGCPALTPRDQAEALARWMEAEDLSFDAAVGGSLGAMVALELALRVPERLGRVGAIGCGGRLDAWAWGWHEAQRAMLDSALPDAEAVAAARRVAMLSFRAPAGLGARFGEAEGLRGWLDHHGRALAARFSRASYRLLLDTMDAFDLGRGRGGLEAALSELRIPLHLLGIDTDLLFTPDLVRELAQAAGPRASLDWITSPHGHDAFLMEWDQVSSWLSARILSPLPVLP